MRAKYTIKLPGYVLSPLSFDRSGRGYFYIEHDLSGLGSDTALYRLSGSNVELVQKNVGMFRTSVSFPMDALNNSIHRQPAVLSGDNVYYTQEKSTLYLADPEGKILWKHDYRSWISGVVPCQNGCFLLSSVGEAVRDCKIERIDSNGQKLWERTYSGPFCTFGPRTGGEKLLFLAGDIWCEGSTMRLIQLDMEGNEICIDEFPAKRKQILWTQEESLFLVDEDRRQDFKHTMYEIRKYRRNAEGEYCRAAQWTIPDPDEGWFIGSWNVSPSGKYLCFANGDAESFGHWTNRIGLISFDEKGASIQRVFLNRDTPINQSPMIDDKRPLVTDLGVVLSNWHGPKANPTFLTDFSLPEAPTRRVRSSGKELKFMECHDSLLYLFESSGKCVYISAFDMPEDGRTL